MAYRIEKFDDRIGYAVQELQFGDVWATIVPDVHIDTARKFAAADDMLEALQLLIEAEAHPAIAGSRTSAGVSPSRRKLRYANAVAVIAKAKGEQP